MDQLVHWLGTLCFKATVFPPKISRECCLVLKTEYHSFLKKNELERRRAPHPFDTKQIPYTSCIILASFIVFVLLAKTVPVAGSSTRYCHWVAVARTTTAIAIAHANEREMTLSYCIQVFEVLCYLKNCKRLKFEIKCHVHSDISNKCCQMAESSMSHIGNARSQLDYTNIFRIHHVDSQVKILTIVSFFYLSIRRINFVWHWQHII